MIEIKVKGCIEKETKFGKPMKALEVEAENEIRKVNLFSNFPNFAGIKEGSVFTANMTKEGNYWNLSYDNLTPNKKPNFDRIIEKKQAGIAEAQSEKAKNIALAQDRSAWMWAKNNACILYGDSMKAWLNDTDIAEKVLELATKIYNGEPTEPFN